MFGTEEPGLDPLSAHWLTFAAHCKRAANPERVQLDVERLPAPRNRLHSPVAMARADEMLMDTLRGAGWIADRHAFEVKNARGYLDYEQGRYPAGAKPVLYPRLVGANVLGIKRGLESTDVVVVGAHHDTIRDSPGADDNTASVAALLELARLLGPYSFRDTIVLAAFDMEELSLFGSRELVRFIRENRRIRGAIIYETMAYSATAANTQRVPKGLALLYPSQMRRIERRGFRGDWTAILYRQSSVDIAMDFGSALLHTAGPEMAILLRDLADLPLVGPLMGTIPLVAQFSRSDHQSFWRAGIPAILVTDTANFRNPNYHLPTDTPDTLDYPRVAAIVEATAIAVAKLAGLKSEGTGFNLPS